MLTIKKRGHLALVFVAAASLLLTACGPPGLRALHKGDRLVQSGHYDSAIEALQTATNLLAKDRTDVLARAVNLLGLAYHRSGTNAASARQCYQEALALDRNLAAADYNLGCLEMEQGNLSEARNWLTTYATLRPRDWDGNMKLGMLNYVLAKKTPVSADRERQLSFDNARKAFEKSQSIQPSAEAWNLLAMIDLLRPSRPSRESTSNAVAKLKAALVRDPQYAPALLNLAIIYDPVGRYKYGDVTTALKAYRQYLALDPPPLYAKEVAGLVPILDRNSRFNIQLPGHDSEQAPATVAPSAPGIIIVQKKTNPPPPAFQPIIPPARTNHAPSVNATIPPPRPEETLPVRIDTNPVVSLAQNEAVPANEHPMAMAENRPAETNTPLTSTLVRKPSFLSRLFGGKPKPAQNGSETAANAAANTGSVTPLPSPDRIVHYMPPSVSTSPGNRAEADRHVKDGAAAGKQLRWKEAIGHYEEAVKADPSYYDACEVLGVAAIKAEDFGVALESLHHALVLDPESANARYDYAWTLQKKNYSSDAAAELEKLLEKHPNEVRAHLLLGTLFAQQLGQPDLARGHYKKVLELNPQNIEAAKIRLWLQNNPEP